LVCFFVGGKNHIQETRDETRPDETKEMAKEIKKTGETLNMMVRSLEEEKKRGADSLLF